ncbi:MAG: PucR family transcriptional regulator, partial [Chitinophagaceae bacterium]
PVPLDLDLAQLRTHARHSGLSMLSGEAASALVLVLGGSGSVDAAVQQVVAALPDAPVVVGPQAADLASAAPSVQEALAGLHAVGSWPQAPRPVPAGDLLAERVALGEEAARRRLLEEVYIPLEQAGGDLLLTASAYLEGGGSVEGAGRALFLHPNTVRYRLRKLTELTGLDVTDPRAGLVVRLALLVGRSSSL